MKPREPRQKVMLAARMRHGKAWGDAKILNISSRGLLLHAAAPPSRGTYVEVRRGANVIVGRVVWAESDRFGVRTQDMLAIDALVANAPGPTQAANDPGGRSVERRARPRAESLEWRYARSSSQGRALQFLFITGLGLGLAVCAYEAVKESFSRPLAVVSVALSGTHRAEIR